MPVKRLNNKRADAKVKKMKGNGNTLTNNVRKILKALESAYKPHTNAEKAKAMKKYMRGQFEYYGINSPDRRKIDTDVRKTMPDLSLTEHHQLLNELWELPQREYQHFGAELARDSVKILTGDSDQDLRESVTVIENMIIKKSWWDCVDLLAPRVIGEFNRIQPEVMGPILDKWITDDNIWLKRTAILHQLFYKENTNQEKLFRYSLACAKEKEFFIRKAIGWALRNQFRVNPSAVKKFVKENDNKLSYLTKKEALKHA
ncbi:hypothetical protein TrispH2_003164 [Trichoplax sp. H2]|uniref:DNA alkylation repair protein n=1 Tax=Trichoplax adhaerens TaxID=10228 RepID=B3RL17_TRIAD|nr:hypothetical protein TRIADDRAFT_51844 [Trichoplax adhaerens]EDV28685.1 hypothetical protein TRIADDRAFT_51844 [Trichoplax adhaerens]RDD45020.1 hypothetical protein TrispH2_003164 [Trichoplax sp. H2]|eukprot:XP_002107887.1 hypothetical protein TRIADDRAFT_51844 [Trichoplax adhaerens]